MPKVGIQAEESVKQSEEFDKICGSMIGLGLGDALGAHAEFKPRSFLEAHPVTDLQSGGTWGLEKGQVSSIL